MEIVYFSVWQNQGWLRVFDVDVGVIICQALHKLLCSFLWTTTSSLNLTPHLHPTRAHVPTFPPTHQRSKNAHIHNLYGQMQTYTAWHTHIHKFTLTRVQMSCCVYVLISKCIRTYICKPHTHTYRYTLTDVTLLSWGLLYWLVLTAL